VGRCRGFHTRLRSVAPIRQYGSLFARELKIRGKKSGFDNNLLIFKVSLVFAPWLRFGLTLLFY
jgi:hypothetical protein